MGPVWRSRRLIASRAGCRAGLAPLGALAVLAAWAVLGPLHGHAQEPVTLTGAWVGTWWMGKYEEPIEMELVQRGGLVSGRVAMLGYPGAGDPAGAAAYIESGRLDGDRLELVWPMGGKRFTATLTPTAPATLMGLGGEEGQVTTGFELRRVR